MVAKTYEIKLTALACDILAMRVCAGGPAYIAVTLTLEKEDLGYLIETAQEFMRSDL